MAKQTHVLFEFLTGHVHHMVYKQKSAGNRRKHTGFPTLPEVKIGNFPTLRKIFSQILELWLYFPTPLWW